MAHPTVEQFRQFWPRITDDNNLTLHGFRRFKTTHLLNLRFLEEEIAQIDHAIYQSGLGLGHEPSVRDRLGLKESKRDSEVPAIEDTITTELPRSYSLYSKRHVDDALTAFGHIMSMETVSLLDDEKLSNTRTDLTLREIYETRLVRADLDARTRTDPFQRWLHKRLRAFRYWRLSQKYTIAEPFMSSSSRSHSQSSHQNTVLIVNVIGRILTSMVTGLFLVVPLTILSAGSVRGSQLAVISVCIVVFSALVAAVLRVSNYEMIVVSAAYAAMLSVFVSNNSGS
ncbi:hypothetical protein BKA67DRAFT_524118 [Truncatella angustata]|uniref:DUF6594 domain-containing protein n=1 Tax=Truncatella angustata TaxID=152316 RepID=A0A9P8ZS55_9PEZI|nr:uncharacterized protein BKA67DRAFT_524118 [Truncatella angustata]KAH6648135.1 hypothetical protein BKA67DRAFT_524118 [Truncatella angustata]